MTSMGIPQVIRSFGPWPKHSGSARVPMTPSCVWGGEEFAVVVDLSRADSSPMELAERVRTAVERLQVETCTTSDGQSSLQVRISLGVATQKHTEAWEGLMKRADQALYAAKQGGRNQVVQAH